MQRRDVLEARARPSEITSGMGRNKQTVTSELIYGVVPGPLFLAVSTIASKTSLNGSQVVLNSYYSY